MCRTTFHTKVVPQVYTFPRLDPSTLCPQTCTQTCKGACLAGGSPDFFAGDANVIAPWARWAAESACIQTRKPDTEVHRTVPADTASEIVVAFCASRVEQRAPVFAPPAAS